MLGRNIAWLREISAKDQEVVGWKAVVLADLFNEAFPVPMAFVLTTQCFSDCLKENNVSEWVREKEKELNWDNESEVSEFSKSLQEKIQSMQFSELLKKELKQSYLKLGERSLSSLSTVEETDVAVRGSPTLNDRIMESALNVPNFEELVESVKRCWSSQYGVPALMEHKRNFFQWKSAVIVQKMARPESSGTLYSANPLNDSKGSMVLEAVLGLQAPLLEEFPESGDYYAIEKKTLKLLERKTQKQSVHYASARFRETVPIKMQEKNKLTENQVKQLCKMAKQLELHYKMPVEMSWAIEKARPIVLGVKSVQPRPKSPAVGKTEELASEKTVSLKPAAEPAELFPTELQSLVKSFAEEKKLESKEALEELVKLGLEKHQQTKASQQAIPLEDKTEESPTPEPPEPERTESGESETAEPDDPAQELKE